jgi:flagellar hook-length control protein FliK
MVSEVSLLGGLGAAVAGLPVPSGVTETAGVSFAALVDKAAAGAAGPVPADGVLNRTFVAEWCLNAPAFEPVGPRAEAGAEEVLPEESRIEPDEDAADAAALELLGATVPAPPVALPPAPIVVPEAGARKAVATVSTPGHEAAQGMKPAGSGPAAGKTEIAIVDAEVAAADQAEGVAAEAGEVAPSAGGRADAARILSGPATAQTDRREPVKPVPVDVAESVAPAGVAAPGRTVAPDVAAAAGHAAEAVVESAPRGRAAGSQLSKAIERGGGHLDQPFANQVDAPRGDAPAGDRDAGAASSEDHGPARPQAGPSHTTAGPHSFAGQIAAELNRQPSVGQVAPMSTSTQPDPAPDAGTTDQIVQAIRVQFRDGIGDAVIRLKPEHLGEVSVSLRVEQHSVSATVHAEVPAVRQWLESQESSLRTSLSEQGLHLGEFAVREDEAGQQERKEDADSPRKAPRSWRPNRGEEEPRFEVVV